MRILVHSLALIVLPIIVAWHGLSVTGAVAVVMLLLLWRWALKKRWCPVYEVLFRAGAVVRPDWRDDPYAFMVEEFRGPICGFTEGSGEL